MTTLGGKLAATLLLSLGAALAPLLLPPTPARALEAKPTDPKEYALQKLQRGGFSKELISVLEKSYVAEDRNRIVELNVLGFLGHADYSGHYSKRALRKCLEFSKKYRRKLRRVQASSGVAPEVIAALLWVETKHGTRTGNYNVGSVYFSLLQADHPEVLKATFSALAARASVIEHKQKVIDRSIAKSNWALMQVKALDVIHRNNPKRLPSLSGSYAGAFGIPQFIPSSYLQWARPSQKKQEPDLFKMEDAIQSVAFYLKANGWKKSDPATYQEALYHYNRAQGYVDVILRLAKDMKNPKVP